VSLCIRRKPQRKRVVHQSSEATNVKDKKAKKELKVKQNKKEKRRRSYILSVMLMQKKLGSRNVCMLERSNLAVLSLGLAELGLQLHKNVIII
jgi:hypothetical protein